MPLRKTHFENFVDKTSYRKEFSFSLKALKNSLTQHLLMNT